MLDRRCSRGGARVPGRRGRTGRRPGEGPQLGAQRQERQGADREEEAAGEAALHRRGQHPRRGGEPDGAGRGGEGSGIGAASGVFHQGAPSTRGPEVPCTRFQPGWSFTLRK